MIGSVERSLTSALTPPPGEFGSDSNISNEGNEIREDSICAGAEGIVGESKLSGDAVTGMIVVGD